MKKRVGSWLLIPSISFLIVWTLIWILYFKEGYAPFGDNSLAVMDANIQYLDFYSYFKDVLSGKNAISYSFSKMLGGTMVGVFTYYLSSPFSILVLFFSKENLVTCFDVMVSCKLALAAFTCAVFLRARLKEYEKDTWGSRSVIAACAVSYALGQYSIAQSSNIMWLDGVYMLPLILLGVYKLVREQKPGSLTVFVAMSIVFNWYTGGINCLFAIIWLVLELALFYVEKHKILPEYGARDTAKGCAGNVLSFVYSMAAGVMISGALFLPTVGAMQNSSRGSLELDKLLDFSFLGNLYSVIEAYVLGAESAKGSVSLFCGSMALLGCIGFFVGKTRETWKKAIFGALAAVTLLLFYWTPLCSAFSLFKTVSSYWYRYSYVGILVIVFIAAWFYLAEAAEGKAYRIGGAAAVFVAGVLLLNHINGTQDAQKTYATAVYVTVSAAMLRGLLYARAKGRAAIQKICSLVLCLLFLSETFIGTGLQMEQNHASNRSSYAEYAKAAIKQTAELKEQDTGAYRISQTVTRSTYDNGLTASYNASLAYGYWAVAGYTSSPDDVVREFLQRLGYRKNGNNMNIVNTSILASDSLLGVRYVISDYAINGLLEVDVIEESADGAKVYENPYCLPMAFKYKKSDEPVSDSADPFEYVNDLYSELLGEDADLYIRLEYTTDEKTDSLESYSVNVPAGNYAVYGNLPWGSEYDGTLDVNGKYETAYARWLSPSVFYIPTGEQDESCMVTVSAEKLDIKEDEVRFYALDLNRLQEVTDKLKGGSADTISMENGYAQFTVEAQAGDSLYIAIPYDSGWVITLNGQTIKPDLAGDCMYSVDLAEGQNVVQMTYHVRYKDFGIACSGIGLVMLAAEEMAKRKRRKK